jgi:mono/diheme cytochrome c family protein
MTTRATSSVLALLVAGGAALFGQEPRNPGAAALRNPVAATPESLAAGRKAYDTNCASCHGNRAQGAEKAGTPI